MITSIQLGNIFNSGGKTVLGGSVTGFDTEALVNSLVELKRLPAVQLEQKLTDNDTKRTALGNLRTLLSKYQDAASVLRNPPGVNNAADNIFEYRNATLQASNGTSGSSYLSVTAAPGAAISDYNITVDQIATYNVKTTETFALADADTVAVGAGLPFNAGTLTLGPNEVDITIAATDTLNLIVSKINAVSEQSGVKATVLQVSDGQYRLQFKTTETGADQNYSFFGEHRTVGTEMVIEAEDYTLNVSRSGDTFIKNFNASAANNYFITAQPSDGNIYTTDIENTAPETGYDVYFDAPGRYYVWVRGSGGSANDSLHIGLNGEVQSSSEAITGFTSGVYSYENNSTTLGGPAYIDVTEAGYQRVNVYTMDDGTIIDQIVLSTDSGYVPGATETSTRADLKNVGMMNVGFVLQQNAEDAQMTIDGTTITRSTNAIDDLVEDVTFNLTQETPTGVDVNVSIDPDTEIVQNAILNFVDTYNELRVFFAKQTLTKDDGTPDENAVLRTNPTLRTVMSNILNELSAVVDGLSSTPNKLADLGITLDDYAGDDETPYTRNILVVDEAQLSTALQGDFDAVRKVFEFDFVSDNADLQIFKRNNSVDVNSFTLDLDFTGGNYTATHSGGTDNVDVTAITGGGYLVKGQVGTVLEGLEMIYGGTADVSVNITLSQGIGDRVYNMLDGALDEDNGILTTELESLDDSDKRLNEGIARIDDMVERYRIQQLQRFSALEQLLTSINSILQSLDAQATAAANN